MGNSVFELGSPLYEKAHTLIMLGDLPYPYDYYGYERELLACRKTAWIGISLMQTPIYDVYGPDAVKLLNSVCVNNDFAKLGDHGCRHGIICNEKGKMVADGVILKIGENHFRSYWLAPVLAYYVENSKLDVTGKDMTLKEYFYQVDGPKSLEILEDACQCDLHDLKFGRHKMVKIDGKDMRVLRLGMSGALGYEVHGPMEEAGEIYKLLMASGEKFGALPLGVSSYCVNHT